MEEKKTLSEVIDKVVSNEVIPRHIKNEEYNSESIENRSQEKIPENKVLDIIETKEILEQYEKKSKKKVFSKWNIFKHKANDKVRSLVRASPTIRVMLKADYTIYPIDLPIEGKTVLFKGRRYKLDGYEHRLYELQGLQCIFVDVNDSRPLELSHKYTNPAYDAREFCSLFDSKAIQDLMSGIMDAQKLDKMYMVSVIGIGLTGLCVLILWGIIKPDWQRLLEGVVNMAQTAASQISQSTTSTGQTISGG